MPKAISFRQGLKSMLFWSIISAAFIGPGTVTTASSAGATFKVQLLWALVFSALATVILQEAAARVTLASGKNLGEVIAIRYQDKNRHLKWMLALAVIFGCAAYEAGNFLGSLSGLGFFVSLPSFWSTLLLGLAAALFLWIGNTRLLAHFLGLVVAFMGLAFLYVAWQMPLSISEVAKGALIPQVPPGSLPLIVGLIGTTIVPYNLFLASGISMGQEIREMRVGIALAVGVGGIISIAILLAGTAINGAYSYDALVDTLSEQLGEWAVVIFGLGLFAAGFSSAITAPLAAAITAQSLFGAGRPQWSSRSLRFRLVWGGVWASGMVFGLLNVQPIPVILLAQVINGLLLPVVSIFLFLAMNDQRLLPEAYINSFWANLFQMIIVGITCFLGLNNIWKALTRLVPGWAEWPYALWINLLLSGTLVLLVARQVYRERKKEKARI